MYKREVIKKIYLLIDRDGSDDHLLCLFLVHVVEAEGIYLGGQVPAHLVGPQRKSIC